MAPTFKYQIKLHKEGMPVRPIVSFINAPTYEKSEGISRMLKEKYVFETKYNVENNLKLIEKLEEVVNENMILVSLDIKDMFTNIAVSKVTNLLENNRTGNYKYKERIVKV